MENEKDIERIEKELKTHLGRSEKPKVPTGYFEAFPDRLMKKIKEEPKQTYVLNSWLLPLTAAAAFALLVLFSPQADAPQADGLAVIEEEETPIISGIQETAEEAFVLKGIPVQEEEVLPRVELDMLEEALADSYEPEQRDEFDLAMEALSQEEIEDYLSTTFNYGEL